MRSKFSLLFERPVDMVGFFLFVTHQRSCDKGCEDVTGSVNYGSKHATVQNEVLRTNAYKFIVCLAELIRVDI